MRIRSASAALLLTACGGVRPADHLRQVCDEVGPPVVHRADLPRSDRPSSLLPDGTLVELHPDEVLVDGVVIPSARNLPAPLAAAQMMASKRAILTGVDPGPLSVVLSADATVPATAVARTLRQAQAKGFSRAHLLAWSADAITPPEPPDPTYAAQVRARLQAEPVHGRAAAMGRELTDALGLCPGGLEAFQALASVPPAQRCETVADGLAGVLRGCALTSTAKVVTLTQIMATPSYTHRPTSLTIDLDPSATPVVLRGDWQSAWSTLAAHEGQAVWPVSQPPPPQAGAPPR